MARQCLLLRLVVTAGILPLLSTAFRPTGLNIALSRNRQRKCARATTTTAVAAATIAMLSPHDSEPSPIGESSSSSSSSNNNNSRRQGRLKRVEARTTSSGGSDRQEFLRRVAAGTFLGASSSLAVVAARPQQAGAFCGEPYPYWAYYTDFDEVFVPFQFEGYSGKVFTRTVGNKKEQKKAKHNPLVIIPGGPGLPHDYLETLEGASKDDRVVVLFDPIGTGNSTALPANVRSTAPDLLGTRCLVAQTNAVVDYLKLNAYHLLGHGTGAGAALELGKSMGKASPRPPGPDLEAVLSVTLASPLLGDNELPPDFLETLRAPYTKGGNEAPLCLETAMQGQNADSFAGGVATMKKERRSKDAVEPLACPVLITYGGRDVIGDKAIAALKEALSGGESPVDVKAFAESGHLAHLDEREEYVTAVQNYVTSVDEAWGGKSGGTKS